MKSFCNYKEIQKSNLCGCYYCEKIFFSKEIIQWIDETYKGKDEKTAICPHCGIDSILGDFEEDISKENLAKLKKLSFSS